MTQAFQEQLSILLVDDEEMVLSALRRRLTQLCPQAHLTLARGSYEAIAASNQRNFDLVISDLRMPSPDGATLLTQLRRIRPEMFRVILSGQATSQMLLLALPVSHQYLEKPCDYIRLGELIGSLLDIKHHHIPATLRKLIFSMTGLPVEPSALEHAAQLLSQESCSPCIESICGVDLGLSIALLRLLSIVRGTPATLSDITDTAGLPHDIVRDLLQSPLILNAPDDPTLRAAAQLLTTKFQLLAQHCSATCGGSGMVAASAAYLGEFALIQCLGVSAPQLAHHLSLRDEVTSLLWKLWGLPQEALTYLTHPSVIRLREMLDAAFPFGSTPPAPRELQSIHEALCSIH